MNKLYNITDIFHIYYVDVDNQYKKYKIKTLSKEWRKIVYKNLKHIIKNSIKKIILLVLIISIVSCGNMATGGKKQRITHRYEVLLPTKDTMYVDAWFYESSSATFTSKRTAVFYDTRWKDILTIDNPIYIKEVK